MKILLPVDGSENSMRAAEYLARLVKSDPSHQVTVLTVAYNVDPMMLYDSPVDMDKLKAESIKAHQLIANKAEVVFNNVSVPVKTEVVAGDPALAIAEYVEKNAIDKIIMGSRGLSNIKGILLGSVTRKVLHLTNVPVTIIK